VLCVEAFEDGDGLRGGRLGGGCGNEYCVDGTLPDVVVIEALESFFRLLCGVGSRTGLGLAAGERGRRLNARSTAGMAGRFIVEQCTSGHIPVFEHDRRRWVCAISSELRASSCELRLAAFGVIEFRGRKFDETRRSTGGTK
jgi:hypothetical protein